MPGAAGHQRDAALAADARIGVGHVYGGGLVARVYQLDPCVKRGIEYGHDVIAG